MQLYCLKCKKKQEVGDLKKSKLGKRFCYKTTCPKCSTKMFQFCASD